MPTDRPLALVTGASTGIGRALAQVFAEHGHDLVVAAVDDAVRDAAAALSGDGCTARAVQVDLATPEGVEQLYDEVRADGRPLALAALNAGVAVGGAFRETDLEADLRLVDLNCRSTVHLAKLVARDMTRAGAGRMLFTSSIAAFAPSPYQATYGASKAFVHSFGLALRHELRDTGVSVTVLEPGPTDTDIFERGGMVDTRIAQGRKDDPADVAADAYEALMAGKDQVVTGPLRTKAQVQAARLLPDTAAAVAAAQAGRPGSGSSGD